MKYLKKRIFIFLSGKKVLIIGAGPCGLRLALETQLLGNPGGLGRAIGKQRGWGRALDKQGVRVGL